MLTIHDIAGLVKGAAEGAGLGNAFLSHVRATDAIYHMVRAFDNKEVSHVEESVDPIRDMDIIHNELRFKDVEQAQKAVAALSKNTRGPNGKEVKAEMDWVVRLVSEVRAVRSQLNVPPGAKLSMLVRGANHITQKRLVRHRELIHRLARLKDSSVSDAASLPKGVVQAIVDEAAYALPVGEVIDIDQERSRLERELQKLSGEISKINAKLTNQKFVSRAPEDVVEEQRERLVELQQSHTKLSEALDRLAAA